MYLYGDFSIAPFIEVRPESARKPGKLESFNLFVVCSRFFGLPYTVMLCGAVAVKKELESTR